MDTDNKHINEEILMLYITGEADKQQIADVENWLKQDADNQKQLEQLQEIWLKSAELKPSPIDVNIDKAWKNVEAKIDEGETKSSADKNQFLKYFYRIAAIVVFGLAIWKIISIFNFNDEQLYLASNNAILTDTLTDGSIITLNKNTKLEYSTAFNEENRRVKLQGEAYFDVEHNPEKPFVIEANNTFIKVLGTSFNVKSFKDSTKFEVSVVEGLVQFFTVSEKGDTVTVLLSKNEKGIFDTQSKEFKKAKSISKNDIYWNSKTLVFEKTELKKVFKLLENIFRIKIEVKNPDINSMLLSATFKQNSIDEIFEVISASFNLSIDNQDNIYLVDINNENKIE